MKDPDPNKSLIENVSEWLSGEGYNTEFRTASLFKKTGFTISRGEYIRDLDGKPREIDVVAMIEEIYPQNETENWLFRTEFVVECKWSKDKPWIIFADEFCKISSETCISQSYGSSSARTLLEKMSEDPKIQNLSLFDAPDFPGFAGRQTFDKGSNRDLFYTTLKAITSNTYDEINRYQTSMYSDDRQFVFAFPIIVVDGTLYKAKFDEKIQSIEIKEAGYVRCHWRGAENWRHYATVDVIQLSYLEDYLRERRPEIDILMQTAVQIAPKYFSSGY